MKEITVVIPVHNGGKYLRDCIDSILNQNYKEFDLVLLENCSTDNTYEWISKIEDKRVTIYPSEKLLTIEENWKRILNIPKNKYLTIVGHDDLLDHNFLEIMVNLIKKYPDASLYHSHFRLIDKRGKTIRSCFQMPEKEDASDFLKSRLLSERDSFGTGYIFRSDEYDKIGGIPQYNKLLFSDDSLWIKLMKKSYKVTAKEECFSYRLHTGSTSGKSNQTALLDAALDYISFLDHCRKDDEKISLVLKKYSSNYFLGFCKEKFVSFLIFANKNNQSINDYSEGIKKIEIIADKLEFEYSDIKNIISIKLLEWINKRKFRKIIYNILIYLPVKIITSFANFFRINNRSLQAINRLDI